MKITLESIHNIIICQRCSGYESKFKMGLPERDCNGSLMNAQVIGKSICRTVTIKEELLAGDGQTGSGDWRKPVSAPHFLICVRARNLRMLWPSSRKARAKFLIDEKGGKL